MDSDERPDLGRMASLPYWWNKTKDVDVPQPKTEYVQMGIKHIMESLRSGDIDVGPLLAAAENVGGYPVFVRTDQMACKHEFDATCFVDSADSMKRHVLEMLEINVMMDMGGDVRPDGIAVREYLELDYAFRAFAGNMPVATEARVFIRDGSVECVHRYWSDDPIERWDASVECLHRYLNDPIERRTRQNALPEDWRDILAAQNAKIGRDLDTIQAQAEKVARVMGGWWSCDVALSRDDSTWYLTDMAPGAVSYHLPPCTHAPEGQR